MTTRLIRWLTNREGYEMARKSLKGLRTYVKGLITRANRRIADLKSAGVLNQSMAYQTAKNSRSKSKKVNYGSEAFSINGMTSMKELNREKGRLLAFLGDQTSLPEGAVEFQALAANSRWGKKFFTKGVRGVTGDADPEILSAAAEAYRRLTEDRLHLLFGNSMFDSDSLINILYDVMYEKIQDDNNDFTVDNITWNPFEDEPEMRKEAVGQLEKYGRELLEKFSAGLIRGNFASDDIDTSNLNKRKGRK